MAHHIVGLCPACGCGGVIYDLCTDCRDAVTGLQLTHTGGALQSFTEGDGTLHECKYQNYNGSYFLPKIASNLFRIDFGTEWSVSDKGLECFRETSTSGEYASCHLVWLECWLVCELNQIRLVTSTYRQSYSSTSNSIYQGGTDVFSPCAGLTMQCDPFGTGMARNPWTDACHDGLKLTNTITSNSFGCMPGSGPTMTLTRECELLF